jgi:hypothetical protein
MTIFLKMIYCKKIILIFILSTLFTCSYLYSQESDKRAYAIRIFEKPVIDGKLNDTIWKKAQPVNDFIEKHPFENVQPGEKTEVRFMYDADNLYIGARMYRAKPDSIVAYVTERDNPGGSERIIISLDTYNDKKTAYSFSLSAKGTRTDYYHSTDAEYDRDYEYNPVWLGKTNIDSLGWTAEFCIPFNQLRFNECDNQIWGLNMDQYTPSSREDIYWVLIPKNEVGWSSRMGKLLGIKGISNTRHIELLPYLTGGTTLDNTSEMRNQSLKNRFDGFWNMGLDMKMDISSNMTLTATVNPDFGQIEADPAVVNLTEFETYYTEKRPFFIENRTLFERTGTNYFYSRRIGGTPHYVPIGDKVEMPNTTAILTALKLTGRTGTGMSFGGLSTLANSEYAEVTKAGSTYKTQVEPLTLYNVFRLQQELDKSGSSFGAQITSANRKISDGSVLDSMINKSAYSGGMDFSIFMDNKKYSIDGFVGGSQITGSQSQMLKIQQNSSHYYQRPDATHLKLDSTATSLSGFVGDLNFSKNTGEHWLWTIGIHAETPGLDFNDVGKIMHADQISPVGSLTYRENKPSHWYNSYSYTITSSNRMNWEYIFLSSSLSQSVTFSLNDDSQISASLGYEFPGLSDTKTRGGPLMGTAEETSVGLNYSSDVTKDFRWSLGYGHIFKNIIDKRYDGLSLQFSYSFSRLKVSFAPSFEYLFDPEQYVEILESGREATYGKRYIFGNVKRYTLSSSIQFDYAFTPDLTLVLYAEPFISNGDFVNYGELSERKSYQLRWYGKTPNTTALEQPNGDYQITDNGDEFTITNRDFRYLSFRSNLVLRWEWLPGSTLYALAQINNFKYESEYKTIDPLTFGNTMFMPGKYTFALKISYWIPYSF